LFKIEAFHHFLFTKLFTKRSKTRVILDFDLIKTTLITFNQKYIGHSCLLWQKQQHVNSVICSYFKFDISSKKQLTTIISLLWS